MGRNKETSIVVDSLLKLMITGGTLSVALLAPNAIQALDKPLKHFFDKMDRNERERELRKIARYMQTRGLVRGDYQHGMSVTKAGRKRAEQVNLNTLTIERPDVWDRSWRLVLFDIPQNRRGARNALTHALRSIGFQLLQQSVWVHPFPCREQVQIICVRYDLAKWVSYIETSHIDHEEVLIKRFKKEFSK